MSWYPNAANHNIPPGTNDPGITARIIVLHTMVGTIESADSWFRGGSGGVEAHFGVAMDGRVWQWRDTNIQADAQAAGNDYCISIETEDMGQPEQRWSAVQVEKLTSLMTWIGATHNIPMKLVSSTSERGVGYHRQFTSWNPNNHSCPGDIRTAQLKSELIPVLQGEDMTIDEAVAAINNHATDLYKLLARSSDGRANLTSMNTKLTKLQTTADNILAGGVDTSAVASIIAQGVLSELGPELAGAVADEIGARLTA